MNKILLVGTIKDNDEIKMSSNNLEILEFSIDDIKVKTFGKLAVKAKDLEGLVYAEGSISLRDYTNKDGKTYKIQDIAISKIESLMQVSKKEESQALVHNNINNWESPKEIVIDPDELPFY